MKFWKVKLEGNSGTFRSAEEGETAEDAIKAARVAAGPDFDDDEGTATEYSQAEYDSIGDDIDGQNRALEIVQRWQRLGE